jgi:hypothetical protein
MSKIYRFSGLKEVKSRFLHRSVWRTFSSRIGISLFTKWPRPWLEQRSGVGKMAANGAILPKM